MVAIRVFVTEGSEEKGHDLSPAQCLSVSSISELMDKRCSRCLLVDKLRGL